MRACPKPPLLERLLAGELTRSEGAAIELHVEACAACQQVLEQMTASARCGAARRSSSDWADCKDSATPDWLSRLVAQPEALRRGSSGVGPGLRRQRSKEEGLPRHFRAAGYEFLEVLGRGGAGVVYKVCQVRCKRLAALKLIDPRTGPERSARFRQEIEALAWVQHPNVVRIHEVGEIQGRPFFAMEYVGGSLHQELAGGSLPPRRAAQLIEAIARGVQAVHDQGILHRDLKPANILITADGVPKVADFGLAKHLDQSFTQTRSGALLGTPRYMAPEQARSNQGEVGPAADVWSLGAILYEALTGQPPFRGSSVGDVLEQICCQEPAPPRHLQAAVPDALAEICMRCLQKSPSRRFASAAHLADELRRYLADDSRSRPRSPPDRCVTPAEQCPTPDASTVEAGAIGSWNALTSWVRRYPVIVILPWILGTVLLLLLLTLLSATMMNPFGPTSPAATIRR